MKILFLLIAVTFATAANAWDGTTENGDQITVETYDHQGNGEGPTEWTDEEGNEHSGYLDMEPDGSGTITDDDTGESVEVDME